MSGKHVITSEPGRSRQSGDRDALLGHLRQRLAAPAAADHGDLAHPPPGPLTAVPTVHSSLLDPDDLPGSFVRNATAAAATVHDLDAAEVPAELVADIVARHEVRQAVLSAEPAAAALEPLLQQAGVTTRPLSSSSSSEAAATADLGVTSCIAALATTGSVVVSSAAAGGRSASLLPRVHLCVVPASVLVASTAEVLRALSGQSLPSNLVIITGPSRSGDIEQIIALGVHGPIAVELVLLRRA